MSLLISRHDAVADEHVVVGGFAHLAEALPAPDAPDSHNRLLLLPMTLRAHGIDSSLEIFTCQRPVKFFSDGPFTGFVGDGWVYGQALLNEADFVGDESESPLSALASFAYEHVLAPSLPLNGMNLARCWNYLPDINGLENNLERYRWFNIGRHAAFARHGRLPHRAAAHAVPAACALGVGGNKVGISFLGVDGALTAIENGNQISAYDYPHDYGPKAPMFSRAVRTSISGAPCLFVSGTASITGHQTMHKGDVTAQTDLAIDHIEHLLAQLIEPFSASNSYVKAYVRYPEDCDDVLDVLRTRWPQVMERGKLSVLIADICRNDLDVEIELCCGLLAATK